MQVLIDEDKRALGTAPDGMEWTYPDEHWQIIQGLSDNEAEVFPEQHDYISYVWNGTEFIYSPKHYD